jgi:hypothetical protein
MNHLRLMGTTIAIEINQLAWHALHGKAPLAHRANLSLVDDAIAKDKNLLHLMMHKLVHNNPLAASHTEFDLTDLQLDCPTVAFRRPLARMQALPPKPKPYAG